VEPLIDRVLSLEQVVGRGVSWGHPDQTWAAGMCNGGSVVCRFWQASENLGLHSFAVKKAGLLVWWPLVDAHATAPLAAHRLRRLTRTRRADTRAARSSSEWRISDLGPVPSTYRCSQPLRLASAVRRTAVDG
jgi:hypothetical protein